MKKGSQEYIHALVKKARQMKKTQEDCDHSFLPDGESKLVPETISSWVCCRCGQRLSGAEAPVDFQEERFEPI